MQNVHISGRCSPARRRQTCAQLSHGPGAGNCWLSMLCLLAKAGFGPMAGSFVSATLSFLMHGACQACLWTLLYRHIQAHTHLVRGLAEGQLGQPADIVRTSSALVAALPFLFSIFWYIIRAVCENADPPVTSVHPPLAWIPTDSCNCHRHTFKDCATAA